jgi:hypothetical protein
LPKYSTFIPEYAAVLTSPASGVTPGWAISEMSTLWSRYAPASKRRILPPPPSDGRSVSGSPRTSSNVRWCVNRRHPNIILSCQSTTKRLTLSRRPEQHNLPSQFFLQHDMSSSQRRRHRRHSDEIVPASMSEPAQRIYHLSSAYSIDQLASISLANRGFEWTKADGTISRGGLVHW